MAVEKQNKNGRLKLKQDLAKGSFETLYILYGEEAYLREYYLRQLRKKVVDETFADFNLIELDGKTLTLESLTEAVDSYPAMSERKLVIVTDFNIYAPPASFWYFISTFSRPNRTSAPKCTSCSKKKPVRLNLRVWKKKNSSNVWNAVRVS